MITQLVDEKKGYYLDLTDPSENIIDEITIDWFDGIDRSVFSRLSKLIEIERVQKICFTHKNATNHPNNLFDVFVKLQSLEIDSCNYSTLDKNFLNGLHIESLYISNCQPVFNPDLFENIKLKTLSITANNIKEVKDINLNNMENLDYLNLMYNKIQTISKNDFNNFSFLKQLNLSGNRIEIIEHNSFDHLIYLEDLILSRNLLTHLNSQMFKKNKNLKTLDISNNENLCSHDILKDLNVENFSIFNTKINYKSIDLQQLRCFAIGSVESSIDLKNLSGFSFIVNELFPENVFMKRNQLKKVVIQIKSNFDLDNLNLNHLNGLNQVEELGLKIQSFNQSKWESKSKIFEDIFDVNQFKTHFYLNALTGSAEISITSMVSEYSCFYYNLNEVLCYNTFF